MLVISKLVFVASSAAIGVFGIFVIHFEQVFSSFKIFVAEIAI